MKRYENIEHYLDFVHDSLLLYICTTFAIEFSNYSSTVGTEEEAVPCAAEYHSGASTDTRK